MKRLLITGANGWIGHFVLQILAQSDYEIHVTSRNQIHQNDSRCVWHQVDLLDLSETENIIKRVQPTHLLHLAWEVTPGKYLTSSNNYLWVQASIALLQNFIKYGGTRVVVAGTCAEYDWRYGFCTEKITPLAYNTPYAASKNSLRLMLETMPVSSCWGRIFFLYGPKEHPNRLVSSITHSLIKNKEALCTDGDQYRDYLHVYDVAHAFVMLLDSEVRGAVNISSGNPVQIKEVVLTVAEKLGKIELLRLGALSSSAEDPLFITGNIDRLRKEVGWKPIYSLNSGLENTIQWWKNKLGED